MFAQKLLRHGNVAQAVAIGVGSLSSAVVAQDRPDDTDDLPLQCRSIIPSFRIPTWDSVTSRTLMEETPRGDNLEPLDLHLPDNDSSAPTDDDASSQQSKQDDTNSSTSTLEYDFVIVGHGNAGQSALQTLREKCPSAKIAVIDPLRISKNGTSKTNHFRDTVAGFHPSSKTLKLLSDSNMKIKYKHGLLIATGSRGAPPPLELFEETALSRVLELRPTELPKNTKRPMMAPETVRKTVAEAAAKGAKIAILGSGWEALDLLILAEQNATKAKNKPSICYASQGPVWNVLPNYLSTELRRKLLKRDIDIQDRSYVRYVADIEHLRARKIELHTARTYDLLDTRRIVLDLLVIAPDSFGAKGTAALPTTDVPERMKESCDGRPWYKTWSQLSMSSPLEPSTVVCFEDDGRIAVNTELCVASRIYAAGGCAKYPNSTTGNSSIAGEGSICGVEAGRVAAVNMAREFSGVFGFSSPGAECESFASNSIPVWRSDLTSYPTGTEDCISTLSSIGVQALCVGTCDSDRLATRGFWWTNSSAQRRITRLIEEEEEEKGGNDESGNESSIRLARRTTRRRMKRLGLISPIYGIGVVFFLDNYGRIQGIMTWGLPFSNQEGGAIKQHLLDTIKHLIATNAGVSALDAEENHQIMNVALGKASQRIVSLAVKGHASHTTRLSHGLDGPIEEFSMPLYRYTEVGALQNKTVNVLKRKDGDGMGILGENLYARDEFLVEDAVDCLSIVDENETRPSNIPETMYPITVVPFQVEEAYGPKAASLDSLAEMNRYLAVQRSWEVNENRARPGKEDPLWLRPGDERKNTSRKEMLIDAYRQIMFPHRS
ncbi:MAG: hypothetical protein SGILL_005721 [Bacillariaceae sp.]